MKAFRTGAFLGLIAVLSNCGAASVESNSMPSPELEAPGGAAPGASGGVSPNGTTSPAEELAGTAAGEGTLGSALSAPSAAHYFTAAGDFNGDGKADLITLSPDSTGGWSQRLALELSTGSGSASETWRAATPTHIRNGGSDRNYKLLVGDFNGDKRDDLVTVSQNGGGGWASWAAVELSTGTEFTSRTWPASLPQHMRNGGSTAAYWTYSMDVNGDGRADIVTLSPNAGGAWADNIEVELSTGAGFTSVFWKANTPRHIRSGGNANRYIVVPGDFNGDGKMDLATLSPNGGGGWARWIAVELSTGTGFVSSIWTANVPQDMRNGGSTADYRVLAGDYNGDGKTDLAVLSRNAGGGWASWVSVQLSTGGSFTSTRWTAATPVHMRNGGVNSEYRVLAADMNGDGRTDLVTLSPNASGGWAGWAAVELSTGAAFSSRTWPAALPQHMRNGGLARTYWSYAADVNGDGRKDLLTVSPNGSGAWASNAEVELSSGAGFASSFWRAKTPAFMRYGTDLPAVAFRDDAATSGAAKAVQGSKLLAAAVPDMGQLMDEVNLNVREMIYFPTDAGTKVNAFESLTLVLQSAPDSVAWKIDSGPGSITIVLSAEFLVDLYARRQNSLSALEWDVRGILTHEVTHGYQFGPKNCGPYQGGTDFYGFIEGLADYVRIQSGLHDAPRVHGGNWNDGYTTTGHFIKWLVDGKDPDFARKLNATARDYATWSWESACKAILGQGVQTLWNQYQASF